jgi:hypothetical protein
VDCWPAFDLAQSSAAHIDQCACSREGSLFASIPLDVWVATIIAAVVGLVAIFGPSAGIFTLIYISLCGYIVVEIISDEVA